jgi:hypothetical protein
MPWKSGRTLLVWSCVGLVLVAPVVLISYRPVDHWFDIGHHPLGVDFVNVWSAPRIAWREGVMAVFDPDAYYGALTTLFRPEIDFYVWVYPPTTLLFATPFSLPPYWLALTAWTFGGLAIYGAVVLAQVAPGQRSLALLILLVAPATIVNAVAGQNGFFTAALLLGGVVLLERRPWLAGVPFGLLVIKPHLALLVPAALLAIGAWRTIAATVATSAIVVVCTLATWGVDPWIAWFTKAGPFAYHDLERFEGFHRLMMPSAFASLRASGASSNLASITQLTIGLAIVAVTAIVFRKTDDKNLRALTLTSGALLASPYAYHYDMTALTGAILWVMASDRTSTRLEPWFFGLAWVLPAAIYYLHILHLGLSPLVIGGVYGMAVMGVIRHSDAPTAECVPNALTPRPVQQLASN